MNDFDGLYTAVIKSTPSDIKRLLDKIPDIHKQEALDNTLLKGIELSTTPIIENIEYLLKLGANPDGPVGEKGILLNYAYNTHNSEYLTELLLTYGADINAEYSNVVELSIKNNDIKYLVKFVENGGNLYCKLLYCNNLLELAKNKPIIEKYILSKTDPEQLLQSKWSHIQNIKLPTINDFSYIKVNKDLSHKLPQISEGFLCIKDDQNKHKKMYIKYGGKYSKKNGWVFPLKNKDKIAKYINEKNASICYPESVESDINIDRPSIDKSIYLYGLNSDYDYLTTNFVQPNLFRLDGFSWDSVDRYMMYKMYEGTKKGDLIKTSNIDDARKKFDLKIIPLAKTPKQLLINHTLEPIAKSIINVNYNNNKFKYYYNATKAKFLQNKLLRMKLINTGNDYIYNKNYIDHFGYEGNLLGNVLMRIRAELQSLEYKDIPQHTNCLTITKYNNNFYVIRGDPDNNLSTKIRTLGNHKTKGNKIVYGKLNLNLNGGPGWLIPNENKDLAKELLYQTYCDSQKIAQICQKWLKENIHTILFTTIIICKFRNKQEIGSDDILFVLKDLYGKESYLHDIFTPSYKFNKIIWSYLNKNNYSINDTAIQLIWNYLNNYYKEKYSNISNCVELEKSLKDDNLLEVDIPILNGLNETESIVTSGFTRLYRILRKINDDIPKSCLTTAHLLLGDIHYPNIRKIYSKKVKLTGDYKDDIEEYKKRFHIKSLHIKELISYIPKTLNKKCTLLFLIIIDYIHTLSEKELLIITKNILSLTFNKSMPSPSPQNITKFDEKLDTKSTEKLDTKSNEKLDTKSTEKLDAKSAEKLDTKSVEKLDTKSNEKLDTKSAEKIGAKSAEKIGTKKLDTKKLDTKKILIDDKDINNLLDSPSINDIELLAKKI
jgi:predicted NAD-dependent protein-ADP-ribosyltransferase YbiA (DUF1768 family)